jgi:hypothetical protein
MSKTINLVDKRKRKELLIETMESTQDSTVVITLIEDKGEDGLDNEVLYTGSTSCDRFILFLVLEVFKALQGLKRIDVLTISSDNYELFDFFINKTIKGEESAICNVLSENIEIFNKERFKDLNFLFTGKMPSYNVEELEGTLEDLMGEEDYEQPPIEEYNEEDFISEDNQFTEEDIELPQDEDDDE